MLLALSLLACSGSAPEPKPVEEKPAEPAPVAPTPPPAPAAAPSGKVLELDATGGGAGAPAGVNFILPAGAAATATAGPLSDGSTGFKLAVDAPGDALVCTQATEIGPAFSFAARMRATVKPGPQEWMGLNLELRARDNSGALISPAGGRYVLLRNLRADADWATVEATAPTPAGATKGELCFRYVNSTGAVEVDRIELRGVGGGGGLAQIRWDLDGPGGENGAPSGAAFYVPPGVDGVKATAGDVGGATGFALTVDKPANALACSVAFPATGKMEASGRVKVTKVQAGGGQYAGFTAEVRSYDAGGALVPGPGSQYIPLNVWKAAGDWSEFQVGFTTPAGATTAKICTRFVDSTGAASVDWLAVSGSAPAPAVAEP